MTRPISLCLGFLLASGLLQAQQGVPKASPTKAPSASAPADLGAITDNVYHNGYFGFSLKLPYGWVDRTDKMREDAPAGAGPGGGKGTVLLAVFERPPEATGSTVNSAIVIAAESQSGYPGMKDAAQYFGPISEVTKANGFTVVNEPYEFPVDGAPIDREDFKRDVKGGTMWQSTLAMLRKGYLVSFTFIAGSDEDITHSLEYLKFGAQKSGK
ncbi:MAG TPA: hypothetical protein VF753_00430 [Terriglobales bacterium]